MGDKERFSAWEKMLSGSEQNPGAWIGAERVRLFDLLNPKPLLIDNTRSPIRVESPDFGASLVTPNRGALERLKQNAAPNQAYEEIPAMPPLVWRTDDELLNKKRAQAEDEYKFRVFLRKLKGRL